MKPSVKNALIGSGISILFSLLLYITNLTRSEYEPYLRIVGTVILIVFVVIAMREQKKLDGGYISYGKAFSTGLIFYIVSSVILTIFVYLYFTVLDPDFVQYTIDKQREKLEEAGNMTQEQIDAAMNISVKFMTPAIMCVFSLLGSILIGTIISLIAAAFVKKERDPFSEPEVTSEPNAG